MNTRQYFVRSLSYETPDDSTDQFVIVASTQTAPDMQTAFKQHVQNAILPQQYADADATTIADCRDVFDDVAITVPTDDTCHIFDVPSDNDNIYQHTILLIAE